MPETPTGTLPSSTDLESLRQQLEASGDFRVLRRLQEVEEFNPPNDAQKNVAVFLDTETTGFDPARDKIIELAMVAFEYDLEGNVYRILRAGSQLEDPGFPLSPEVSALTGITDEDLAGQRIDEAAVEELIGDARLVIAHNAAFDRPFVERRLPRFADLPWACSIADVGWRALGFGSSSMEFLAYKHGFFFDGHRALVDCRAGVEILAGDANGSGERTMARLRENALGTSVRIWAEDSPFASKDLLKERRYRWNAESRAWWTEVAESEHDAELEWLAENVYPGRRPLPYFRVTARERYSERVPERIPANAERR